MIGRNCACQQFPRSWYYSRSQGSKRKTSVHTLPPTSGQWFPTHLCVHCWFSSGGFSNIILVVIMPKPVQMSNNEQKSSNAKQPMKMFKCQRTNEISWYILFLIDQNLHPPWKSKWLSDHGLRRSIVAQHLKTSNTRNCNCYFFFAAQPGLEAETWREGCVCQWKDWSRLTFDRLR